MNRKDQHLIKHIDSSELLVCSSSLKTRQSLNDLFKNADSHKTMKGIASYARGSKGIYFEMKIHLISDLKRRILAVKITTANVNDRDYVIPMAEGMDGLFVNRR